MAGITSSRMVLCTARSALQHVSLRSTASKTAQSGTLRSSYRLSKDSPLSQGSATARRYHKQRLCVAMASDSQAAFEVYCKGDPKGGNPSTEGTTLDCPFSQRVMMTLGEKNVKFQKQLCDEQDLPKFLGDHHPEGKPLIPVVRDIQEDKWIGDSEEIVKYIEKKYPNPKLGMPEECSSVGDGLFPDIFLEYLTSEGADEEKARSQMEEKYKEIDAAFAKSDGPFLSGKEPCSQCFKLAPQLYHISVATDKIKGWPIPKQYENIYKFLSAMKSRPCWGPAAPVNDDVVVDGWKTKIKSQKEES